MYEVLFHLGPTLLINGLSL